MLTKIAEHYARKYHKGQLRKGNGHPYIEHLEAIASLLRRYGYSDEVTLAIGWLHDTVEDTPLTIEELEMIFGRQIANGVDILTKGSDRAEYNARFLYAPKNIQMVKLCDVLHNTSTLECLADEKRERKIRECETVYIPLAREVCPEIAHEIERNIQYYYHKMYSNAA